MTNKAALRDPNEKETIYKHIYSHKEEPYHFLVRCITHIKVQNDVGAQ